MQNHFGGKHRDKRDAPPAYSAATSASELPPDYDRGCFFLCELGVHVYLSDFQVVHFSGLRTHGGNPPTPPASVEPVNSAYWFMVICYPPGAYVSGTGRSAFAALPNHEPFCLAPEMTNLMYVFKV